MFKPLAAAAALALTLANPAWAADKPKLNDAEIAHIAYTAGQIDIDAAKQAQSKTKDAEVRMFADEMARDHAAVNEKALALVKKLGVTPQDNDMSKSLSDAAKKKLAVFGKVSGAAFDRAYIENEVAFHKTVNGALRDTLIPSAQNAELKQLLEIGLKLFQEHQMHAEHVAGELTQKNAQASK